MKKAIPKLILLDIHNTGLAGYETCEIIKNHPLYKEIPVFFCTATPASEVEKRYKEIGADGYIIKPFDIRTGFDDALKQMHEKSKRIDEIRTLNPVDFQITLRHQVVRNSSVRAERSPTWHLNRRIHIQKIQLDEINDLVALNTEKGKKKDLTRDEAKRLMSIYEERTSRYAVWRGTLTVGFKKWLKDELKSIDFSNFEEALKQIHKVIHIDFSNYEEALKQIHKEKKRQHEIRRQQNLGYRKYQGYKKRRIHIQNIQLDEINSLLALKSEKGKTNLDLTRDEAKRLMSLYEEHTNTLSAIRSWTLTEEFKKWLKDAAKHIDFSNFEEALKQVREEIKRLDKIRRHMSESDKEMAFNMLQGIFVFHWDNEIGPVNDLFYPGTLRITNDILTQIYSSHRYQNLRPGFASITFKDNKVLSFFSGTGTDFIIIKNYVVALLLRKDEKPAKYREILKTIAVRILEQIRDRNFKRYFDNNGNLPPPSLGALGLTEL